ncbi:MAG: M6 family metalloprotease domain-containing protein [Candidatus Eisenbacteria bacterium]|nr:M6 family metalloprotease domain-containing protein [Candidatus Eisenbacteria bacterium]
MPLNPEVVSQYKDAGLKVPIEKTEARFIGREGATINRPSANRPTLNRPSLSGPSTAPLSPNTTTLKAIVILVGFTDNPPGGPTTRFRATVWDSMLFKDAYIRSGSHPADTTTIRTLKNYYREVSYAQVDVVTLNLPSAIGWVYAPNNYAYYCTDDGVHDNGFGPYPNNVQRLVMDAVIAADPVVDFSQYASGGWVQNLFVVHAGSGAEWSGGPKLIWSHAWSIATGDGWGNTPPALYVDGVRVGDYSMEPEAGGDTMGEAGSPMTPMLPTVGVYCHEFGHILGLPDEYDYGYESQGVGRFSLMAGGSWSRVPNVYPDCAGNSPSHPSAWCIEYLGFVTPVTVTTATTGITIPPIETTPTNAMYKVVYPGTSGKEYWLLENRQQIGFDQGFITMTNAAHGLCIYHVDQNVLDRTFWLPNEAECVSGGVYQGTTNCNCASLPANPNNGEKWYGVSVEQADGLYQMELGTSSGYWQDFYSSATGKTAFNAASSPNSSSYYNHYSCAGLMAATNISEVSQNITLDLTPDAIAPTVSVVKPNGGETFYFSTQDTIRWTAGDNLGVDHIDIYYSTDGGSTFPYTVSTGEANDGWYLWTIPATASTTCKVKVVAYDAAQNPAEDVSDATFTIRATPAVPALSPLCVVALAVGLAAVAGLLIGRKRLARRS